MNRRSSQDPVALDQAPAECREFWQRWCACFDGELPYAPDLDAHMIACASCAARVERSTTLRQQLRSLASGEPAADLEGRIVALARERRAGRRASTLRPSPKLARAAAALIGFGTVLGTALWLDRSTGIRDAPILSGLNPGAHPALAALQPQRLESELQSLRQFPEQRLLAAAFLERDGSKSTERR